MNLSNAHLPRLAAVVLAACSLVLAACGGGSGSGSVEAGSSTGRVAVMITDAPTDHYEEIHVTFTGIYLLPSDDAADSERIALFEGEETLDLLQLRDYADLFTVAEDVPIGDYEKVRLEVSRVELVDTDTDPPTSVIATLPSGKIDLVPSEPLSVAEDLTLYLEIDVDATHSLLVTETGTGELIFRPVVFVRTFEEEAEGDGTLPGPGNGEENVAGDGPLLSVSGRLRVPDNERLLVCPSANAAEPACVRLALGDDSAVFNTAGEAVEPDALTAGTRVIAMGLLERDPDDGRRVLDVLSITIGTRPTVGTRGGVAAGPVDENGLFAMRSSRTVSLHEQTPVVDSRGGRLDTGAIVDGQGMTVMGIVGGDPLLATLVVIRGDGDDPTGSTQSTLRGELVSVETEDTLQMEMDRQIYWVRLESGGSLVISGQGDVSDGSLMDLAEHERVRITAQGEPGTSYFEARRIIAIILGRNDQVAGGGGRPPHAGPPDHAGPPPHAGGPNP